MWSALLIFLLVLLSFAVFYLRPRMKGKRYYLFVRGMGATFFVVGLVAIVMIFQPGITVPYNEYALIIGRFGIALVIFGALFLTFSDSWILGLRGQARYVFFKKSRMSSFIQLLEKRLG